MSKPYALLSFLWALVIFLGSSLRMEPAGFLVFPHSDKLLHVVEFAILALLILKAFAHSPKTTFSGHAVILSFMMAICYGAVLELYQGWLGYRDSSFMDFISNFAGVVLVASYTRWLNG